MHKFAALVSVVVLGSFAPGAASASATGRSLGDPVRFLAHVVQLLAANRYAEAWRSLEPADQRIAPERLYVACEALTPIPGRLVRLSTLAVGHDRIGVTVRFRLLIAGDPLPAGTTVIFTAHAVAARHRWAWILPPTRRALYRRGCNLAPRPKS